MKAYAGAFLIALVVGCYTHYEKIVQNEHFGYPQVNTLLYLDELARHKQVFTKNY
jgi:hypothetical protein